MCGRRVYTAEKHFDKFRLYANNKKKKNRQKLKKDRFTYILPVYVYSNACPYITHVHIIYTHVCIFFLNVFLRNAPLNRLWPHSTAV